MMSQISKIKSSEIRLFSETSGEMRYYFSKFAEGLAAQEVTVDELSGWLIRNVQIFKVGTYNGQTYTTSDLDEMVDNFKKLKSEDIFDPVFKKNHSENVEDQIGWIYDVRRDGDYLVADIHVTDWTAYDKINSKTWRYVSSEIYPPALAKEEFKIDEYVLRAVAVVSVPKVKGLNGLILNSEILDQEKEEGNIMNREQVIALLAKAGVNFSEEQLKQMTDEDLTKKLEETVNKFAESGSGAGGGEGGQGGQGGEGGSGAPQNFGEAGSGVVMMSASEIINLSEQITGLKDQVKNFSEEISSLKKDGRKSGIVARVDKLVREGKVLPAEKDEIIAFAEKLDDNSLESYLSQQEKRPKVLEFGEVGEGQGNDDDADVDAALEALNKRRTF